MDDPVGILMVDDQPAKLLSYELILAELGETLIKASSARDALEHLLRADIAAVLIDVCMPDLDGFELAQLIREHPRFQQIPIIFVSAIHVSDLDSLRGYECGAVDYVPVPVVPEVLRAKVRVFAELHRKTRALERLNRELETRVQERTTELEVSAAALHLLNDDLEQQIEERTRQREQALAQLFEAQKIDTIGQLTGGVAHDFNNLLTAILGSLRLLRRQDHDTISSRLLDNALQSAERGAALTQRLLAFARRQDLRPEAVDIRSLVCGIEDLLGRALGPAITVHNLTRSELTRVKVDANQLELAILNLAVNARDAMQGSGTLTITAEGQVMDGSEYPRLAAGTYVVLKIADTGEGMDEAVLARATEPFFTTKGVGKGTGLGLSMVQGLAEQSGGALQIDSRRGEGTTITLWLPVAEAQELATHQETVSKASSIPLDKRRILLIDDDALVCKATAAMLEDLGHIVIDVHCADEALAVLEAGEEVDLVITDYAMPGMTGLELAHRISAMRPKLPIVLASGYADLNTEAGASQILPRLAKPFLQEDLTVILKRVLRFDSDLGSDPAQAHTEIQANSER